mgnify:CR=1 FL=1
MMIIFGGNFAVYCLQQITQMLCAERRDLKHVARVAEDRFVARRRTFASMFQCARDLRAIYPVLTGNRDARPAVDPPNDQRFFRD